jgi:voltage-gated potassium channel
MLNRLIVTAALLPRPSLLPRAPPLRLCDNPPPSPPSSRPVPFDSDFVSKWPGTKVDTVGDGKPDSLLVDTLGDGVSDTLVPLDDEKERAPDRKVPLQDTAQRILSIPGFEGTSFVFTFILLSTFAIEGTTLQSSVTDDLENAATVYFGLEFFTRWWASGFSVPYLLTPLMLVDVLNLLPALAMIPAGMSGASGLAANTFAPLRLLRALRVLRLRRLLGPAEATRLLRSVTGDPQAACTETQRVGLRVALSVLSIVLISAGVEWQLERDINPLLATYGDALYFSVTTLTTVGLGDVSPATGPGRLVLSLQMLAAVTVIPYEVASLGNAARSDAARDAAADDRVGKEVDDEATDSAAGVARGEGRTCQRCGLTPHQVDARYCRRCGTRLAS